MKNLLGILLVLISLLIPATEWYGWAIWGAGTVLIVWDFLETCKKC